MKGRSKKYYRKIFRAYPDMVTLLQFREMLSGVSDNFARKLIHEKHVIEGYTLNKATMQKITRTCPPPSAGKQKIYAVWRQARAEEAQRRAAPSKKISFDRRKFAPYLEKLGSDKELEELFLAFLQQQVG